VTHARRSTNTASRPAHMWSNVPSVELRLSRRSRTRPAIERHVLIRCRC